jgi:hypothetical protein
MRRFVCTVRWAGRKGQVDSEGREQAQPAAWVITRGGTQSSERAFQSEA